MNLTNKIATILFSLFIILFLPVLPERCPLKIKTKEEEEEEEEEGCPNSARSKKKGKKKKNQDLDSGQHFVQNNTPNSNKCEDMKIWGYFGGAN